MLRAISSTADVSAVAMRIIRVATGRPSKKPSASLIVKPAKQDDAVSTTAVRAAFLNEFPSGLPT